MRILPDLLDLLDLLLPRLCAGCGRSAALLCAPCLALLTGPAPRPVWPATVPQGLPRSWTSSTYEGPIRAIIVAHKESGRTSLAAPLGTSLARAIKTALARAEAHRGTAVVPIPSARSAVRRRGHDPTMRMAAAAIGELRTSGTPVTGLEALRQRRGVADQAGLTAVQRAANLAGALEVVPGVSVAHRRIILVDDVITTGSTLAEAARALRSSGADVMAAATVAATPRHHPPAGADP